LVRRNPQEKILAMHRLVQVVLRYDLEEGERRLWVERVVGAVNWVFSYRIYEMRSHFERYLSQIYGCEQLIEHYCIETYIAIRLLHHAGGYLQDYAHYDEAERFYQKALSLNKKIFGDEHRSVAATLYEIGVLYFRQGKYEDAEKLYLRALAIFEKILGDQPYYILNYIPPTLDALGILYRNQQKYEKAMEFHCRALKIHKEVAGGVEYAPGAITLQNIALLHFHLGEYQEADKVFKKALDILNQRIGLDTELADVATVQFNLAYLYEHLERYQEANELYQQALSNLKKAIGSDHPDTVNTRKIYRNFLWKSTQKEVQMSFVSYIRKHQNE
jgi:tetratricopeptide (TPR) repeat protein